MNKLLLTLLLLVPGPAWSKYCAAIRGNGELISAHWGSFSKIVESYGLPEAMAGGSSASITMFLVESVAMNPWVKNETDPNNKKQKAALLIKSFEGYFEYLSTLPEIQNVQALISQESFKQQILMDLQSLQQPSNTAPDYIPLLQKYLLHYHSELKTIANSKQLKDLINPDIVSYALTTAGMAMQISSPSDKTLLIVEYRLNEMKMAIETFGKFDARTDNNIFFRHGLVSFKGAAKAFNRMANFYSGHNFNHGDKTRFARMLQSCEASLPGMAWTTIASENSLCRDDLGLAVHYYRERTKDLSTTDNGRIQNNIGEIIPSFPTTAVLTGNAKQTFEKLAAEYERTTDPLFGNRFQVHSSELKFGYWGSINHLERIENYLKNNHSNDFKSSRFLPLGMANWGQALSLSPAEPGLARLQSLPDSNALSAGGWSDLHPTLVLRGAGCERILYITRTGGETKFGQGVAKRLLSDMTGLEWEQLTQIQNNIGRPDDTSSLWAQMYNIANPKSSLSLSIAEADAVWCTNWDDYDVVEDGMHAIISESYTSPIYIDNNQHSEFFSNRLANLITEQDNVVVEQGYRKFVGCIPN